MKKEFNSIWAIIFFLFLFGLIILITPDNQNNSNKISEPIKKTIPTPTASSIIYQANKIYKVKKDSLGAFSEDGMKTAIRLLNSKDDKAFDSYYKESGEIFILHKNKEIVIVKVLPFTDYLLVRLKDENNNFYLVDDALK